MFQSMSAFLFCSFTVCMHVQNAVVCSNPSRLNFIPIHGYSLCASICYKHFYRKLSNIFSVFVFYFLLFFFSHLTFINLVVMALFWADIDIDLISVLNYPLRNHDEFVFRCDHRIVLSVISNIRSYSKLLQE